MASDHRLSDTQLEAAVRLFDIEGRFRGAEELRRGHIHTTYVSTWDGPQGSTRYLHQRLNSEVFRDIPALMHNVGLVTRHLAGSAEPGALEALKLVPAAGTGADYAVSSDAPWRTYHFIEGAVSYDHPRDAQMAFTAAAAFGDFQVRLASLDARVSSGPRSRLLRLRGPASTARRGGDGRCRRHRWSPSPRSSGSWRRDGRPAA